jgi:hypothetical protein
MTKRNTSHSKKIAKPPKMAGQIQTPPSEEDDFQNSPGMCFLTVASTTPSSIVSRNGRVVVRAKFQSLE